MSKRRLSLVCFQFHNALESDIILRRPNGHLIFFIFPLLGFLLLNLLPYEILRLMWMSLLWAPSIFLALSELRLLLQDSPNKAFFSFRPSNVTKQSLHVVHSWFKFENLAGMMRDAIYYILYIYIYIDVKLPLYTCVFGFLKIHFFACHDFVFLTLYLFVFCPGEFPIIQTVFSPSDFFFFLKSLLPTLYSFYFIEFCPLH